ncbi:unnamed protein product [Ectocarpus sp. 12 AP-2014]
MQVLELGAGMSGLAGLGVAACSDAAEVVITDGNPDALRNLEECVELNAKEGVFGDTRVAARRLVWDSLDRNGDRAALNSRSSSEVGGSRRFDLIIASDCLFFKDFHDDLISTIGGLLQPGGRAVLVQPQRGGTVNLFMQRVAAAATAAATSATVSESIKVSDVAAQSVGDCGGGGVSGGCRVEARLVDRFDDKIWALHQGYMRTSGGGAGGRSPPPSVAVAPPSSGAAVSAAPSQEAAATAAAKAVAASAEAPAATPGAAPAPAAPAALSTPAAEATAATAAAATAPPSSAPAPPAATYLPDEHQPLLVEIISVEGKRNAAGTSGDRTQEPEASAGHPSWTSWSGSASSRTAPTDGTTIIGGGKDAEAVGERDSVDYSGAEGGGGGGIDCGGGFQAAPELPPVTLPLSSEAPLPPATPLLPSSTAPAAPTAMVAAATAPEDHQQQQQQGKQQRPDRRMVHVYEALAERVRLEVRERRRRQAAAAAGPEAGAVGHAAGSGAGVRVGEDGHAAVEGVKQRQQQQQQLWVAVAGAPGSGKTTLAAEVCRRVQSEEISAICLPMDGYHLYRRELDLLPDPRAAHRRRGAHWTFDGRRFLSELGDARRSERGSFPGFDHATGDPVENQWVVQPSHSVVIVEGNYLLLKGVDPWDQVGGLFDVTWAIRCPPEVCGERVRRRHMSTGLGEEEARARVEGNDLPNARLVSEKCPWSEVDVVIDSL